MKRECVEKFRNENKLLRIYQDKLSESPDQWGDDGRFLVFDHRDFCVKRKEFNPRDIYDNGEKVKGYHVFRCYAYIHSGVALSVGPNGRWPDQRWDVSFKGFWLIKREKGTWTIEQAKKVAEDLCKTWNQYLSGDVYGFECIEIDRDKVRKYMELYNIEREEDINEDDMMELYVKGTFNSCWRFYGRNWEENGLFDHAGFNL